MAPVIEVSCNGVSTMWIQTNGTLRVEGNSVSTNSAPIQEIAAIGKCLSNASIVTMHSDSDGQVYQEGKPVFLCAIPANNIVVVPPSL